HDGTAQAHLPGEVGVVQFVEWMKRAGAKIVAQSQGMPDLMRSDQNQPVMHKLFLSLRSGERAAGLQHGKTERSLRHGQTHDVAAPARIGSAQRGLRPAGPRASAASARLNGLLVEVPDVAGHALRKADVRVVDLAGKRIDS